MKMILKLFALPLLLLVKVVCILGNLFTNISSWAIGLLLLVIAGCGIYCIVQAQWMNLAILAGMGLAVFLILFVMVYVVFKAELLTERLGEFIRS